MKKIVFTHTGHSHALGNFEAGGVANVPDELARHFVDDACCAVYADAEVQAPASSVVTKPAAKKVAAKKGGQQ